MVFHMFSMFTRLGKSHFLIPKGCVGYPAKISAKTAHQGSMLQFLPETHSQPRSSNCGPMVWMPYRVLAALFLEEK